MRNFDSGATRDTDESKFDYEGFLSPKVLEAYAAYMNKNRVQADGKVRDSDNWQKGIPRDVYMKSLWRHFFAAWKAHRAGQSITEELCGVLFNAMGYMHEEIVRPNAAAFTFVPAGWTVFGNNTTPAGTPCK